MAKSRIGKKLYELLVKNYTYKQWNKYPEELNKSVLERIPIRNNFDTRYLESHINDLLPPQHDEFKFIISAVLNEHLNKSKFSSIRQNFMSSSQNSRKKRIGDAWNTWRKKSR